MRHFSIGMFVVLILMSADSIAQQFIDKMEPPLKIETINERVTLDEIDVSEGQSFEEGLLQTVGESSRALVSYFDGDTLSIDNALVDLKFGESDDMVGILSPEKNLNIRIIKLLKGRIQFQLTPRLALSKVSYKLLVGEAEIHFKDADIEINHTDDTLIVIHRGEASIVRPYANTSEHFHLGEGECLQIRN